MKTLAKLELNAEMTGQRWYCSNVVFALFVFVGILTLYGSGSPRFLPFEKQVTGLTYLLFVFAVLSARNVRFIPILLYFVGFQLAFSIGIVFQVNPDIGQFVTSAVVITALCFAFLGGRFGVPFLNERAFGALISLLFGAMISATFFPDQSDFNRFEPPAPLLVSWVLVGMLLPGSARNFIFFLFATAAVLYFGYLSQWRFSPMSSLFVLLLLLIVLRPFFGLVIAYTIIFLAFFIALTPFDVDVYSRVDGRFASLLDPQRLKGELGVRFLEVSDAIRFMNEYGNLWTTFFGFGHGAFFFSDSTISEFQGVAASSWKWRFTDQFMAHTIHFGPIRIYFRYGVFGLIVVGMLFLLIFRELFYFFGRVHLSRACGHSS